METTQSNIEPVTMSDVLALASWERERSSDELLSFISRREAVVSSLVEE